MRWQTISILAAVTALLTLALISLGGAVHATGSSLACPDWPLCYGQFFPDMVGGVLYEHSHRLLGGLVGLLTVAVAVGLIRQKAGASHFGTRPGLLAVGVLLMVLVQAVLGGLTVIFLLPTMVSTAHLGLSMLFLCAMTTVAVMPWLGRGARGRSGASRWLGATVAVLFVQIVLGGLVRHTQAGMSCGTDPWLCAGLVWPGDAAARLQVIHRLLAIGVAVMVVAVALRVARRRSPISVRRLAWFSVALVATQIVLGGLSVTTVLGVAAVTAHLAVAAALLVSLWVAYLLLTRQRADAPARAGAADMTHAHEPVSGSDQLLA